MKINEKYFYFSIDTCCFPQCFSQQIRKNRIQQQLKDHVLADTFKVNRLLELAQIRDLSYEARYKYITYALDIARQIHYLSGEGIALTYQVEINARLGKKAGNESILLLASKIAKQINDQKLFAKIFIAKGFNAVGTDSGRKMINYFLSAEKAARSTDKAFLSETQRLISDQYSMTLGDFPLGIKWGLESMKNAESAKCQECITHAYNTIGSAYLNLGDYVKTLYYYNKALQANKQVQINTITRVANNNIGEVYRLTGKNSEAIRFYQKALMYTNDPLFTPTV